MSTEKVLVHAPVANYGGSVGSVRFTAGVAEVDVLEQQAELRYMIRAGYGIGRRPVSAIAPAAVVEAPEPIADQPPAETPATAVDRPARSASKAAWVDFALRQGATRDEVEDLTKAALQERFGGQS